MSTASDNQPASTPDNLPALYHWIDKEHLLVLSNDPIESEYLQPLGALQGEIQQSPGGGILTAINGAAALGQVVGTLHKTFKTTGYLRFTPETMKLVGEGLKLPEKNGEFTGNLRDANGRYAGKMAVEEVPINPASNLTTEISNAIGQFSLSMQILEFSKNHEQVLIAVNSILEEQRQIHLDNLKWIAEVISNAWHEADREHAVDDHIFDRVRNLEAELGPAIKTYRNKVQVHLEGMKNAPASYLEKYGQQVIFDVYGMLLAEESWVRWNYLRIANINYDTGDQPRTTQLLADLDESKAHNLSIVSHLMNSVDYYAGIFTAVIGRREAKQDPYSIANPIYRLTNWAVSMEGTPYQELELRHPKYLIAESQTDVDAITVANAILHRGAAFLAFAEVSRGKLHRRDTVFVLTSTSLHLASTTKLKSDGKFEKSISFDDIISAISTSSLQSGPTLVLRTKKGTFKLTFGKAASTDQHEKYNAIIGILKDRKQEVGANKPTEALKQ